MHFDKYEGDYVSISALLKWARDHPLPSGRAIPVCLWGSKGVGKTSQVKAYCDEHGLQLQTYHPAHDQTGSDIIGIPERDPQTGRSVYSTPFWLPVEGDDPGVLFIDEINRATRPVLQGLMEPLGEGTLSQSGWKLPSHWQIVVAANPGEVGYDVEVMDDAMVDRMLHYAPGWDAAGWANWARSKGLPDEVIGFTLAYRSSIDIGDEQLPLEVNERHSATPRSMEYLAAMYTPDISPGMLRVVTHGLLGRAAAPLFIEFHNSRMRPLTYEKLLEGNYKTVVAHWRSQKNWEMMSATVTLMLAGLIDQEPTPQIAARMARFLVELPPQARDDALSEAERSAPAWVPYLRGATDALLQRQARGR